MLGAMRPHPRHQLSVHLPGRAGIEQRLDEFRVNNDKLFEMALRALNADPCPVCYRGFAPGLYSIFQDQSSR